MQNSFSYHLCTSRKVFALNQVLHDWHWDENYHVDQIRYKELHWYTIYRADHSNLC